MADKAVGQTRGGLNTKLHTIVDSLRNPVIFLLSTGKSHDAIQLLEQVSISGNNVLADQAYGATFFQAYIREQDQLCDPAQRQRF